jgi:hypothetical protein
VIDQREREEVIRVLTNGATWRQSCGNGHTTALNRDGRWCSDGEMVPSTRRRDYSRGGCDVQCGCSHCTFYRVVGRQKMGGRGEGGSSGGTSMAPVTGDGNGEEETMWCGHF